MTSNLDDLVDLEATRDLGPSRRQRPPGVGSARATGVQSRFFRCRAWLARDHLGEER